MIIKESEHNIQASFVDWVLWTYGRDETFIRPLFFAVPNGAYLGGKSPVTFMKLKKEGFLQGVADLLYLQPRGPWSYLALELKTEKRKRARDRGLSEDQVSFLESVSEVGGLPVVTYGLDEAIEAFTKYMSHRPRIILGVDSVLQSRGLSLKSEESRP